MSTENGLPTARADETTDKAPLELRRTQEYHRDLDILYVYRLNYSLVRNQCS